MFVGMNPYQDALFFKGWLKRMMVTAAVAFYHYHREDKLTRDIKKMIQNIFPEGDSAKMRNKASMSLVKNFSPPYRIVFNLFVIDGFTHEEIAALLPSSTGTSQNHLLTARTILHQRVRRSLPDKYWKYV